VKISLQNSFWGLKLKIAVPICYHGTWESVEDEDVRNVCIEKGNEMWDEEKFLFRLIVTFSQAHLSSVLPFLCFASHLRIFLMSMRLKAILFPFSRKSFEDISTKSHDDDFYASFFSFFFALVTRNILKLITRKKTSMWKWKEKLIVKWKKKKKI
jgi:hypothetical protein